MWDVFFFGTARSTESQTSDRSSGIFNHNAAGFKRVREKPREVCPEVCQIRDHRPPTKDIASEAMKIRGRICEVGVNESDRSAILPKYGGRSAVMTAIEGSWAYLISKNYAAGK